MDIKNKSVDELEQLCTEIRQHIVDKVYQHGGHLSSNLGVVELTVALHYVFDFYHDKLLFDVGHQCYAHKILTDRDLSNLRTNDGPTGFPNPSESAADMFSVGHGTTSISQALGLARARDIKKDDYNIVAMIGDGAFGGGMAFEALNDLGFAQKKMIIVLNDNEMSISPNVGALSKHFSKLSHNYKFSTFKNNIKRGFQALPILGNKIINTFKKTEKVFSDEFGNNIIKSLGIKYMGPYDGHDLINNIRIFQELSETNEPVLVHFLTSKGKGVDHAQNDPENFHGVAAKNAKLKVVDYETEKVENPQAPIAPDKVLGLSTELDKIDKLSSLPDKVSKPSTLFADYMVDTMIELAERDDRVVSIVAGMTGGTGMTKFGRKFPERFIDVGMAEQHATTMAAGLAKGGCKPFFAVYSTFLQRAFDQVIHDVCINNQNVVFLIDRAGVNGADGVTHQGVYDIAYLTQIPNMVLMSPKDGLELASMIKFAHSHSGPMAIRYPKNFSTHYNTLHRIDYQWEFMRQADVTIEQTHEINAENNSEITTDQNNSEITTENNTDIVIVATGNKPLDIAMQCNNTDVVHATFIKPFDSKTIDYLVSRYKHIITIEDGVATGGFGQQLLAYINNLSNNKNNINNNNSNNTTNIDKTIALPKVHILAHPDQHIFNLDQNQVYKSSKMDLESVQKFIDSFK